MGRRVLSTWNQIAPRAYQRQWFCFPQEQEAKLKLLTDHLRLALDRLATYFPHLSGKISLLSNPPGYLCIDSGDDTKIPLKIYAESTSYPWTYAQLKAQGFPARAFVDKSFDLPYQLGNSDGIPVFEVHVRWIEGGLLLCIYCHHSVSDGTSVNNIVNSFAQLSRDPEQALEVERGDINVDIPNNVCSKANQTSFDKLLAVCPEYHLLSSPTGPTQFRMPSTGTQWQDIKKTGRIFVIGARQIKQLQHSLAGQSTQIPSTFTCLAALTWAFVTKARLNSPKNLLSSSPDEKIAVPKDVRLMISIDWRKRAFADIMSSTAGNAVALPKTALDTNIILDVCSADEKSSKSALAEITRAIDTMVGRVDDDFVALRTTLFRQAPDPRFIGVDADPRDPRDFYFNTWRHFGGDTRWKIPGVAEEDGGSAPEAIRRAQGDWNMGAGLILPARKGCSGFEVMVTLDVDAMKVLCEDAGWNRWVDEILG
ncbi:hypothetical protein NM208_g8619 [Fusarium decemcellulare]|uniref:Uncharacterized protein n=2 Tax=Fusarium decemcellulare TaxID=57161 RepID=A0ACC1RZV9_9HYPO|nr:hypothetical protein NM208_g9887 [Fusarium decemcellulare]KAJ3532024.1 hypothetical protein NM208_g8619 [Fusarium decemcellulare]